MTQSVSITTLRITHDQPRTPSVSQTTSFAQSFVIGQFRPDQTHAGGKSRNRFLFQSVAGQPFRRGIFRKCRSGTGYYLINLHIGTGFQPPLRDIEFPFHHPQASAFLRPDRDHPESILFSFGFRFGHVQRISIRRARQPITPETLQTKANAMSCTGFRYPAVGFQSILGHGPEKFGRTVVTQSF